MWFYMQGPPGVQRRGRWGRSGALGPAQGSFGGGSMGALRYEILVVSLICEYSIYKGKERERKWGREGEEGDN